jgi:bifunctional non-homologous end joining protein LigD
VSDAELEYVFDTPEGEITVATTHIDRVMFPADGITKREVIEYYHRVADYMLPELRDRALSMERYTKGIDVGGFFQKHVQKHYPAWIERATLGIKTKVEYPICNSAAALVYFANQGGVAFHIWTSRTEQPDHPDVVVFDLDPPEGNFELARDVARRLHELLDELELPSFVKTTGSKGLHVVVPTDGKSTFADVMSLCGKISAQMIEKHPELVTAEFHKVARKGRLYFDVMRNALGATFVAPYSLRGKPGAPISAPIAWKELDDPKLRADAFRLRDIRKRLDKVGDPWAKLRAKPISVKAALNRL